MSYITQRGQGGPFGLTANGLFQQSVPVTGDTSLNTVLGTRWDLEDGRELVLVLAGAANLVAGQLQQDAATTANHQNLTTVSFTAYNTSNGLPASAVVTLGGTAITVNQYALGYAVVTSGTGLGQTLQISGNTVQATTTGNTTITFMDAPNTALDATSKISLIPQPGNGVIINSTTRTGQVRGVALYPVTAAAYAFLVSKGTTSALIDTSAPAAGAPISPSSATAGAVAQTRYATNVVTDSVIGRAIVATTSAQYQPVTVDL